MPAVPAVPPAPPHAARERPFWLEPLAPYSTPSNRWAAVQLCNSVVPYLALSVLMYFSLRVSYLLTLALAIPTAGFLVRIFIIFHDCTHGSFTTSKRANTWIGSVLGLGTFSSFACWQHAHLVHHAHAGDLDRRGVGDLPTKTVREWNEMSPRARREYRIFRHPLAMFGLGPIVAMMIQPRIPPKDGRPRIRRRVHATNLALVVLIGFLCWLIGWQSYLLIELPVAMVGGAAGIWLFYVQHQFEDVYWASSEQWTYADAALQGSSYLKLPRVLRFFTGNIGLHHVHHLSARIPNYYLQRAQDETTLFDSVPTLTLRDGVRATRLKLYDERSGRMVTFAQARSIRDADAPRARASCDAGVPGPATPAHS